MSTRPAPQDVHNVPATNRLQHVLHIGQLHIGTRPEKKCTRQEHEDPPSIYHLPPELLINVMKQTDILDPKRYDKLHKSFCKVHNDVCDDEFWRDVVQQLVNVPLIDDFHSNYKSFSLPEEKIQSWSDIVRQVYDAFHFFTEDQLNEVVGRRYVSWYGSTQWIHKQIEDFAGNRDALVVMAKLLLSNISTDSVRKSSFSRPGVNKLVQAASEAGTLNIDLIRVITRSALKGLVSSEQKRTTLLSSAENDDTELMSYLLEAYGGDYTDRNLKTAFQEALGSGREDVFKLLAPRLSPDTRIRMMRAAEEYENEEAINALIASGEEYSPTMYGFIRHSPSPQTSTT